MCRTLRSPITCSIIKMRGRERPAIVEGLSGAVLTYAQLARDVDRCAAGLAARGLAPGEVVGI